MLRKFSSFRIAYRVNISGAVKEAITIKQFKLSARELWH